ncbi:MAG: YlmC/YmxH family sporulation protein [Lachnospiraceae bacterium]|nr:YlmC/YmxH family sporulation protein [Lachnospiraceae bacterium]
MRFCELKEKDVINICDCKRLGNVADLEIDCKTGRIEALIIFDSGKLWGLFGKDCECTIPWCNIKQIGPDIILVEVPPEKLHHS